MQERAPQSMDVDYIGLEGNSFKSVRYLTDGDRMPRLADILTEGLYSYRALYSGVRQMIA